MTNTLILSAIAFTALVFFLVLRQRNRSKRLKELRAEWGKPSDFATDIETARLFFDLNREKPNSSTYRLDESSWRDLNFDEIFQQIDRTSTPTGAQCLFNLMRHPLLDQDTLSERERLIACLSENGTMRESIQLSLRGLEDRDAGELPRLLWESLPARPLYLKLAPVLSVAAILLLILVLLNLVHFAVLFGVFAVNLFIRSWLKREIGPFISSIQFLGVLIKTADRTRSLKSDELNDIRRELSNNLSGTRGIARRIVTLGVEDNLGVMEYINTYFLSDVSGYSLAVDKIEKKRDALRKLYETVGELDALISIASFRSNHPNLCHPSFDTGAGEYAVEGICNPLIESPVPNSFRFENRNVIVTGSNMAGKTTFLKTIGVNAILAQTLNVCLAESYRMPMLKVVSSIAREDDIVHGKSYYLAEVESVLRIIESSGSDAVYLFLIDELFRGTNSVERLAASIAVLEYLANGKDFILVATHDLQLSETLKEKYADFHFREQIRDGELFFDYKLHPGISNTRNAIELLKHAGYPQSIIDNATGRIAGN